MHGIEKELGRDELIALVRQLRDDNARLTKQNEQLQHQVQQLQQQIDQLRKTPATKRLEQSFSLKAEEQRQAKKQNKRKRKQNSPRRGRRETQQKIDQAERIETVTPEGFTIEECTWLRERPVWRIENGRAVQVVYDLYRGPGGEMPAIDGVLPRGEYGLEIHVGIAFLVYVVGLSIDKVCRLLKFFWKLDLSKSQADALLNQLACEWKDEFEALCQLLATSAVVHADETSWSINSVWAFLSEKVRLLIFGCRKDADTLAALLPKETFQGILVSDDAAVYRDFSKAQKCWAHLLRKAIRLTLLEPENDEYRRFLDGLLDVYRTACRFAKDKRLSEAGRLHKVDELNDMMCALCGDRFVDESQPTTGAEKDYFNLVHELVRLLGERELFTFVVYPAASGTNNESERTLRDPARDRGTGRTSKTLRGARRRTVLASVLESLRLYLAEFTLDRVLAEVTGWVARRGGGLFQHLAASSGLDPPAAPSLAALLPQPIG